MPDNQRFTVGESLEIARCMEEREQNIQLEQVENNLQNDVQEVVEAIISVEERLQSRQQEIRIRRMEEWEEQLRAGIQEIHRREMEERAEQEYQRSVYAQAHCISVENSELVEIQEIELQEASNNYNNYQSTFQNRNNNNHQNNNHQNRNNNNNHHNNNRRLESEEDVMTTCHECRTDIREDEQYTDTYDDPYSHSFSCPRCWFSRFWYCPDCMTYNGFNRQTCHNCNPRNLTRNSPAPVLNMDLFLTYHTSYDEYGRRRTNRDRFNFQSTLSQRNIYIDSGYFGGQNTVSRLTDELDIDDNGQITVRSQAQSTNTSQSSSENSQESDPPVQDAQWFHDNCHCNNCHYTRSDFQRGLEIHQETMRHIGADGEPTPQERALSPEGIARLAEIHERTVAANRNNRIRNERQAERNRQYQEMQMVERRQDLNAIEYYSSKPPLEFLRTEGEPNPKSKRVPPAARLYLGFEVEIQASTRPSGIFDDHYNYYQEEEEAERYETDDEEDQSDSNRYDYPIRSNCVSDCHCTNCCGCSDAYDSRLDENPAEIVILEHPDQENSIIVSRSTSNQNSNSTRNNSNNNSQRANRTSEYVPRTAANIANAYLKAGYTSASRTLDFTAPFYGILKQDGSINNGFELVTQPISYKYAMEKFPWEMFPAIEAMGGQESSSCGIHVHVSRAGFSGPAHVYRWMKFFYRNAKEIKRIARREGGEWSSFDAESRNEIKKYAKGERGYRRYCAINTQNDDTFEVRVFATSLDPVEIKGALALVHASVEYTRNLRAADILKADGWTWNAFVCFLHDNEQYSPLLEVLARRSSIRNRFDDCPKLVTTFYDRISAPNLEELSRVEQFSPNMSNRSNNDASYQSEPLRQFLDSIENALQQEAEEQPDSEPGLEYHAPIF